MTLVKPTIQEVGAAVHMRTVRMAYSAFLSGSGLAEATDYSVTGDPTSLSVNISGGTAFLQMPGIRTGYEPLISDAAENRLLGTAPASGTRTDLVYLGIRDKEFGDPVNDWDIFLKTNQVVGTNAPPAPDTMAATYPLARVDVPPKVTKGSQCKVTKLSATTAPTRDGGFVPGDVNLPAPFFYEHIKVTCGGSGVFTGKTACPFVPKAIIVTPTDPMYFSVNIVGSIVIDRTKLKLGSFVGQAFNVAGAGITTGGVIEFGALFIR